jgi:hypothetical protein
MLGAASDARIKAVAASPLGNLIDQIWQRGAEPDLARSDAAGQLHWQADPIVYEYDAAIRNPDTARQDRRDCQARRARRSSRSMR